MMSIIMSAPQEITVVLDDLSQYIHAPRGKELLTEIRQMVGAFDRRACLASLTTSPTLEGIDNLERLTHEGFVAYPGQDAAARTDGKRVFNLMRLCLKGNHSTALVELLDNYTKIFPFGGSAKAHCGALRSTCIMSTEDEEHRFESPDQLICPVCGTPRALCHKAPRSNGRCASHGGRSASSGRMTRGMIYRDHITNPESVKAMEQIEQDAEAISLIPEIGLLTTRVVDLIDQIEQGIDPKILLKQLQDISKRANTALNKDDPETALDEINRAIDLFESRGRAERLWGDVLETIKVLGTQTERERKRVAMEKQMIPIERVLRLQDETIDQIQTALSRASNKLAGRIIYLIESKIVPELPVPERLAEVISSSLHDRRETIAASILSAYEGEIDRFMAEREGNLDKIGLNIPGLSAVVEGEYSED